MKRLNHIWDTLVSEQNGICAVIEGTHKKRGNREVQKLLYDDGYIAEHPELSHMIDPDKALEYVRPICQSLLDGTYHHDPPRHKRQFCQSSSGGKWRDLYIPTLKDHIVHHMLMQASMSAFTKGMHPHCCGSVPERGINYIVKYVSKWLQEDLQCRYFVKLDIRHCFDSIALDRMKNVLQRKIKDAKVLNTWDIVLNSAPICCPIGYYPSPWLANLYLEDLDWYIEKELYKVRRGKRIKYVRHYLRYADDMLLIGTSKTDLRKAVYAIIDYLRDKKGLDVKTSWEIKMIGKHESIDGKWKMKPGTYWCDIGGYKFCKDCTILRDGIFLKTKRLAKRLSKQDYYTEHQCKSINASIAWAEQADSETFLATYVLPYVDIKTTRRMISNVDKNRKQRERQARCNAHIGQSSDSEQKLSSDSGNRGT